MANKYDTIRYDTIWLPLLRLNTSQMDEFPWDDIREMFSGCQWMAKVPNGEEKLPKILTG